ncbi:MAG TPA: lipopolysaccharide biosynthesis protein [Micromonosporaceae bacterium]|nr:lipopolysaccharide biosynthesis protein [Micromonosporaceae bacterium]
MQAIRISALGRTVRRHAWVVCLGLILGVVAAGIALARGAPVYESTTSVLVLPVGDAEVNLPTEAALVASTETAIAAGTRLGVPVPTVASVEVLPNTSVLVIRFEAETPQAAQAGARAFAEAYLANRAEAAEAAIQEQLATVNAKLADLEEQAAALHERIASVPESSPEAATLRGNLAAVTEQNAQLLARANELATTTINPGRVIGEAELPTAPVRPVAWQYFALGAASGTALALLAAVVRDQLSRRVRHASDVVQRSGVALLAELPGVRSTTDDSETLPGRLLPPHHPAGRAFHRLRNELVAALRPEDRILLVVSASSGCASTVVTANLAAALARADNEVIVVGTNVPEIGSAAVTLAQLFDVGDIPGLTDVLAGRTALADALQKAARTPHLRVVTPGGTASAGGLLQSEGARHAIAALQHQARYLVLEAPPTASGADAQSLAGVADVAILVVELGRSSHADVADAATQLARVGVRVLGAVVVPAIAVAPDPLFPHGDGQPPEVWLTELRDAMTAPTTAVKQVELDQPGPADQLALAADQPAQAADQPGPAERPGTAGRSRPGGRPGPGGPWTETPRARTSGQG